MQHIGPIDFIRLASGELPDARRREVEAHLGACEVCRQKYAGFVSVWTMLGAWTVDAGARDQRAAVARKLDARRSVVAPRSWRRAAPVWRIAAALVIGVGLGHLVGRLTWSSPATIEVAALDGAEQQAVEELGLQAMEWPSAAGLFPTVLELIDAPAGEEGRP